jgi:CRP-like cAMP-binding protein
MTARCKTDVRAATITYDRFKELYFQNPEFGFYLLRLVVARLHSNELQFAAIQPSPQ